MTDESKIKERALSLCAEFENKVSELRNIYKTKCADKRFSCALHARTGAIEKCENTYCMIEQISAWTKNICRWLSRGLWAGSESKQNAEDLANETIPLAREDNATLLQVLDQRVRRILASVDVEVRALREQSRMSAFLRDHALIIVLANALVFMIVIVVIMIFIFKASAKKQEIPQLASEQQ